MTAHPDPARADVDVEAIRNNHCPVEFPNGDIYCDACSCEPYPCDAIRLADELAALRAERDSLKHLHSLDHSLADQWQAKNTALETDNAALRARAERAEAALREMDQAFKATVYSGAAQKMLHIRRLLTEALADLPEETT